VAVTTLWNQTGHESRAALRKEAEHMIRYLRDHIEAMSPWEQTFMTDMLDQVTLSEDWVPTAKQLFKLRDLNVKY
jgi:hypothetical protein